MKKTILTMILVMTLLIVPVKANALEINVKTGDIFQIAAKKKTIKTEETEMNTENYNQINECSGDDSMLGSINDPNSVAWLLQQIFNYIKILGPLLVVVLSSVEFAKVIIQSDDEAMAKAQKKLITRIILAACLFLIPTLVSAALDLFGITSNATCGLE